MGMYGNINTPFGLGSTYFQGAVPPASLWRETVRMEGMTGEFADVTGAGIAGVARVVRSPRPVVCRLVRNAAATPLLPGRAVAWAAEFRDRRVSGDQATLNGEVAGIVDEHLPAAGVAPGDLFWLVQGGQVRALTPPGVAIAAGTRMAATGGASPGTLQASPVTDADAAATFAAMRNVCGHASEAIASGASDRRLLVNLTIRGPV